MSLNSHWFQKYKPSKFYFFSSNFDGLYFWNQWDFIVLHFKGLIELYLDLQAQGRDSIFTFCHAQLKKVQVAGLF